MTVKELFYQVFFIRSPCENVPLLVERTFAWTGKYSRMSKDYKYLSSTSETMIYASMTKTMLNRWRRVA